MIKYFKIFEIIYLIIAVVFLAESYMNWSANPKNAYMYLAFAVLAVFMYFFRKKSRKRYEEQKRNTPDE